MLCPTGHIWPTDPFPTTSDRLIPLRVTSVQLRPLSTTSGQLRLFRGTSDWQSISRVTSDRRVSPFINSTHLTLQYRTRDQDGNCNVKKRLFTLKQWSLDVNRNWQLLFWSHCHSSPSVGARSWSSRCRCIWGENRDQELTIVRFDVGNKGLLRTIQKEEPTTRTSPRR